MTTKMNKSFLSLTLVTALLLSLFSSVAAAAPNDDQQVEVAPKSKMLKYVDNMQPGWNLGNTLDATGDDETSWGNPRVTKELINNISAQGYKSIRLPITWDNHIGEAPDYTIEKAYLDRVEEVVGWALEADLYVMINIHHDSWLWVSHMEEKHDEVLARYNAAWTQIADRFKSQSDKLMFESINEPRFTDGGSTDETKMEEMLVELNTSFYTIVRKSGGNNAERPLVLPSLETTPSEPRMNALYNTITALNDPNLIATVHYYGFWPFSVNIAGHTTFDKDTKTDITQTFDNVYNTFIAKGIPVIIGEFGLLGFDVDTGVIEQGEKLKFFEYLTYYAKEKKITTMLWDNGQHLNRTTHKWSDPELHNILMSGLKERSSTLESDQIFLNKNSKIKDTNVNLNLNGNKFKTISANNKYLIEGKDYTLKGEALTLKASKLSALTASKKIGEEVIFTVKFNKGVTWKLKLIVSDTIKLSNAKGTTEAFAIPSTFNGNQLATMEAVYPDGSNAGPQDWTSFKEFGYTFTPSYDTNEIKLLPNFFKDVKDSDVTLKFHFWNGDVISYKITKNGTNVVGTAL
ncbi:cellulase family glycosylhydrolase [Paenibacillus crassostreae]|uniref:Cellulase n=1 Tax=Paenibacillus crassostreae TaxID=1763538 RepID=A0A167FIP2_9BACL|nr:cellulase family glycosylhydrolase [Paenibacillus crassostreae]AOZ94365.1 cellulase [Paenibacillus crassostreae]OAB76598.1 cellulase [Paenibacillus crassostreae]